MNNILKIPASSFQLPASSFQHISKADGTGQSYLSITPNETGNVVQGGVIWDKDNKIESNKQSKSINNKSQEKNNHLYDFSSTSLYSPHEWRLYFEKTYGNDNILSSATPNISMKNIKLAGNRHPETGIVFDNRGFPVFEAYRTNWRLKIAASLMLFGFKRGQNL